MSKNLLRGVIGSPGSKRFVVSPGAWPAMLLYFALTAGVLWAGKTAAQTKPAAAHPSNRWLLIVQTSGSMQDRAAATRQIAAAIVASGMNGQMHAGDTLGVWTFNTALSTGHFPLQEWSPDESTNVAGRVYEFLGQQRYEKGTRLQPMLRAMEGVVEQSHFITVVLISDGLEKMRDTPFDGKINATYAAWRKEQKKKQLPFITVLRAQGAKFTGYTVTVPPWPLQMPPLPAELKQVKHTPKVVRPRRRATLPPLIIRGEKPREEPQPPAPAPAAKAAVSNSVPPGPAVTNEAVQHENAIAAASAPPAPKPPPAAPLPPAVAPTHAASASEPEPGRVESTRRPAPPAPTPATATEPPAPSPIRSHVRIVWLGIVGVFLGGLAIGIVFLLVRRSQAPARISLITRSLDRRDPPGK